ncbi:MAG: Ca2+/H+ antiporter, family, partial [Acidimicrobiaceae bacterium]
MALTFATRFKARDILIGITIATAVVHLFSVGIGAALGATLPTRPMTLIAGLAFLGFAAWTLRGDELTDDEAGRVTRTNRSAIVAASAAFFLAEQGDKTM